MKKINYMFEIKLVNIYSKNLILTLKIYLIYTQIQEYVQSIFKFKNTQNPNHYLMLKLKEKIHIYNRTYE